VKKSFCLKVFNLSKKYGDFYALKNISFELPESGIYGLLGTNGAGKTTLLGMILGLITPSSGDIFVFNKNFSLNYKDLLKRMNFESPYVDLPKKLTVKQNLIFYSRLYGVENFMNNIEILSKNLKIFDLLERNFGTLSAGQKTRVGLCKALINKPDLLLLDEPTASLDPETSMFVRKFLLSYQKVNKISILIASHNMAEVESICKRVIILDKGRIKLDGKPEDLVRKYKQKNLEQLFINIGE
tara:strand:- start:1300 stop:2025 length:726 start_codon:yes stop_codon:yes gene_type:complete